jgi:amino acid adenylation domain-containing protein
MNSRESQAALTEAGLIHGAPDLLIQDLFIQQARRAPDRPALIAPSRTLSYISLYRLSQLWAGRLWQSGARPNTLVGIVMEKGWEQIVAVLAILGSGAAYLPIDVTVPRERLHYLLKNGEVDVVLTQSWLDSTIEWPAGVKRFAVDLPPEPGPDEPSAPRRSPDDLAYVLYTSGSTGLPKGVMIAHRGLVNSILDTNRTFGVTSEDRALAVTALHHDMSAFDIFGMLAAGGAVVIPSHASSRAPDHWIERIGREQVTIWNSVPAFMEILLQYAAAHRISLPGCLRLAFLGGDWIPVTTPARIRAHFGDVNVVSVGGPTETTLWNIWYPVRTVDPEWRSIPYGHPIANTRYYVMDDADRECPAGVAGELCCAGVGLMKGYWRDEERTRVKFSVHPVTGEPLYHTGDRGRLGDGGEIEFLGRMDTQVKIHGQRIELGEIESVLTRHPHVVQAAVIVVETRDQKRLAAYVKTDDDACSPQALHAYLKNWLPHHMIPSAFVRLADWPLTSNGKIDRKALPPPVDWSIEAEGQPAEQGATLEAAIAAVWRKVLDTDSISPVDNFFDIGGDSLRLIAVHTELERKLNRKLPVTDLFEFPSIRSLAKHLEVRNEEQFAISDIERRARRQRMAMAQRRTTAKP